MSDSVVISSGVILLGFLIIDLCIGFILVSIADTLDRIEKLLKGKQ